MFSLICVIIAERINGYRGKGLPVVLSGGGRGIVTPRLVVSCIVPSCVSSSRRVGRWIVFLSFFVVDKYS